MIDLRLGDCLEVMKDIKPASIDAIITDPPYGTTACKWDSVIDFDLMWEQLNRIIKPNGAICLFGKEPFSSALRMSNIKQFKYDWIWIKDTKSNFMQANYQPLNNIEIISVFSRAYARAIKNKITIPYYPQFNIGKKYKKPKATKTSDLFKENHKNGIFHHSKRDTSKRFPYNQLKFNIDRPKKHPTQKPVALLEYLIKTYTLENETVLDFTMGSGTTGVAAKNLNRNFIGIEKDDKYFEIAKNRIINQLNK